MLKKGIIKESVLFIAAPGASAKEFDAQDIELKQATKVFEKSYFGGLKRILACANRDSVVLDALTEEFKERYPAVRFAHIFPGFVRFASSFNNNLKN